MNVNDTAFDTDTIFIIRQRVMEWGRTHYKEFPWRTTNNKWHGLIAEMLQRTRVGSVVPVYQQFVNQFPGPASILNTPLSTLAEILYPLGLPYRT
jgi:A/G-specific adenine glycosylase